MAPLLEHIEIRELVQIRTLVRFPLQCTSVWGSQFTYRWFDHLRDVNLRLTSVVCPWGKLSGLAPVQMGSAGYLAHSIFWKMNGVKAIWLLWKNRFIWYCSVRGCWFHCFRSHKGGVSCVQTWRNKLYSCGADCVIKVWDLENLVHGCKMTITAHTQRVSQNGLTL